MPTENDFVWELSDFRAEPVAAEDLDGAGFAERTFEGEAVPAAIKFFRHFLAAFDAGELDDIPEKLRHYL